MRSHSFTSFCEQLESRGISRIHLIGIGGAGMCAIAEILHGVGFDISGSDQYPSEVLTRLSRLGIQTFIEHDAKNIQGAHAVVFSTAIHPQNPELLSARQQHLPIIRRGEMLAELMRFHTGISIAGSHGKTTTSHLVGSLFLAAKLDPTLCVGGRLESIHSNAHLGRGSYFVAEADESDASLLYQRPTFLIVTNLDADHMDTYQQDVSKLYRTFHQFIQSVPFYGMSFLGIDDPHVQHAKALVNSPVRTFGLAEHADIRAINFVQDGWKTTFTVLSPDEAPFCVTLNLPGKHNVQNALGAIGLALWCGISIEVIQKTLANFKGVWRRNQHLGDFSFKGGQVTLIDDYGHHPVEIKATYGAVKAAFPKRRVLLIYQLHRFTRTRDLFHEFTQVLGQVDKLILTDIYAASESPLEGVTTECLTAELPNDPLYAPDMESVLEALENELLPNDVLLVMGAGNINVLPKKLIHWFNKQPVCA